MLEEIGVSRCAHDISLSVQDPSKTIEAGGARPMLPAPAAPRPSLYDVTTLHFENDIEDELRKRWDGRERRVDPHQVGLLVDRTSSQWRSSPSRRRSSPSRKKTETRTLVLIRDGFKEHHGVNDPVAVADAGCYDQE